ncbi:FH2 domain-containing protein 1-like [Accipiter gentilis]|uniref:FH2 domain-containing protein 1-like n=1 Tax=Astur gentilis TaxID=8957 RepID=UPI00210F35CA|nr:FH2 domain-containing protein 1-like [Accipiter gentilis]
MRIGKTLGSHPGRGASFLRDGRDRGAVCHHSPAGSTGGSEGPGGRRGAGACSGASLPRARLQPGAAAPRRAPGRGGRLRALHWEPVPAARVRGRRSVWVPRAAPPALDLPRLRLLFREPRGAAPGQRPPPAAALLEPKRSLALGVFLKQVKRPVRQIVRDIQEGVGAPYGAEKLLELSRMLPSATEVARLRSFPGSPHQLADPELFMLLLTEVPSYTQRLELLVLKEDFFPRLTTLCGSIQILTDAAVELLECEELHTILHLILSAGNYLNSGSYAGSAAGFRLASLLKLPDTKANEPGVDLLHFVAMEAARVEKSLLDFPDKLRHVGPASRIEVAEVEGELRRLAGRLEGARILGAEGLGPQLQPFLRVAEEELRGAWDALEQMHRAAATTLDFFCEDTAPGGLQDLCAILHGFTGRLLTAAQENRVREQAQHRRQQLEQERLKRRSIATCSARDVAPQEVGPRGPFPLTPQPGWHGLRSLRPSSEPCLAAPRGDDPLGSPGPPGCGSPRLPPALQSPTWPPRASLTPLRRHTAPALPALPEVRGCDQPSPGTPASRQRVLFESGPELCLPEPPPPGRSLSPRQPHTLLQPGQPLPAERGPEQVGVPPAAPGRPPRGLCPARLPPAPGGWEGAWSPPQLRGCGAGAAGPGSGFILPCVPAPIWFVLIIKI